MGDQLGKMLPAQLRDRWASTARRTSSSRTHAVFKAMRAVAQVFGVEEFEVYQARRGLMVLETTEPLSVCVGQDVVRRFNAREQKFLLGRAALGLLNKTAVLAKLSQGETADLFGNSVRIHAPQFTALGRRNDEPVKQLRKAYSRKALKALEMPAMALGERAEGGPGDAGWTRCDYSADRAGLLMCGDVAVGLGMVLREDPNFAGARLDSPEPVLQAVRERASDLRTLLALSLHRRLLPAAPAAGAVRCSPPYSRRTTASSGQAARGCAPGPPPRGRAQRPPPSPSPGSPCPASNSG